MRHRRPRKSEAVNCFNPRTCTRCDLTQLRLRCPHLVSIHAPVRDATQTSVLDEVRLSFQSTHLYEMRQFIRTLGNLPHCFNPRTCTRCDFDLKGFSLLFRVSIHAPVRDATSTGYSKNPNAKVSIHAPVRDATLLNRAQHEQTMFQSTHLYEMRPYLLDR